MINQENTAPTLHTLKTEILGRPSEEVMSKHAKTFYFASLVFSKKRLEKISKLYSLCRYVDDCADELEDQESLIALKELEGQTDNPLVPGQYQRLLTELEGEGLERDQVKELIAGAWFDNQPQEILSKRDLLVYCYRVAGVVGLMMCPFIGVSKRKLAGPHAIDLGIGMQLTNICRDVLEDAQMGRTYIPKNDLEKFHLGLPDLSQKGVTPFGLKSLVRKILKEADLYYESAYKGLSYIPLRPRLVILFAGEMYRAIGKKLISKQVNVLSGRVYLNPFEKVMCGFLALRKVFKRNFWSAPNHESRLHREIQHLPGTNQYSVH